MKEKEKVLLIFLRKTVKTHTGIQENKGKEKILPELLNEIKKKKKFFWGYFRK